MLDRVDTNRFRIVDGEGTKGTMEYLFSSPDLHVIYSEGTYDGPLYARTVRGRCLMVLRTSSRQEPNGRFTITSRLDTFLAVDNLGVEILAQLFIKQGSIGQQRLFDLYHGGQWLHDDDDFFRRVFGQIATRSHDHRDWLPHMTHFAFG